MLIAKRIAQHGILTNEQILEVLTQGLRNGQHAGQGKMLYQVKKQAS